MKTNIENLFTCRGVALTRSRIRPALAAIFALLSTPCRAEATRRRVNFMPRRDRVQAGQRLAKAACLIALALFSTLNLQPSTFAQGTAFTYQGQLQNNGSPASGTYDMTFTLFNTNTTGVVIAGPVTNGAVVVTNGLFTVLIDFGPSVFTGETNWLQIGVESNGVSSFTTLAPRQLLTPVPYAIYAEKATVLANGVAIGAGSGNTISISGATDSFIGGGNANDILFNSFYSMIGGGQGNSIEPNAGWSAIPGGNNNVIYSGWGTIGGGGGNSISNNSPFSVIAGGQNNTVQTNAQNSFIGAGSGNEASGDHATVAGGEGNTAVGSHAFIGGGAQNSVGGYDIVCGGLSNSVSADKSGVGSGIDNSVRGLASWIGGGQNNNVSANYSAIAGGNGNNLPSGGFGGGNYAFIGGGRFNTNASLDSTIAGGWLNGIPVNSPESTIGGGYSNNASGASATVGGGALNTASGFCATVPGGDKNVAGGDYSFAAGQQAQANNQGAFVWADSQNYTFSSTANDQFLIRAQGGVGINTALPQVSLDVNGGIHARGGAPGGFGTNDNGYMFGSPGDDDSGMSSLGDGQVEFYSNGSEAMRIAPGGNVGIGITTPSATLEVSNSSTIFPLNNIIFQIDSSYPSGIGPEGGNVFFVDGVGDCEMNGACSAEAFLAGSDRNAKENFAPVSAAEILDKVAALPISRWNFKNDKRVEHLGPMAQDFYAAFNVGRDDKHIATVDEDGVALAAIQGLNQKLSEKDAEIQQLQRSVTELKQQVSALAHQPPH